MVTELACKKCNRLVRGKECQFCKSRDLTSSWKGIVVIVKAAESEVAKKLGIEVNGEYALMVK